MENHSFIYSKAAALQTLLFVEQRRYEVDADYTGERHVEVSSIKDKIAVQIANSGPSREVVIGLEESEWNEIVRILEFLSEPRGASWDNGFDVQHALSTIAEQLLEDIRERRGNGETYS